MSSFVTLPRDTNQALGIGKFAVDFMSGRLGTGPTAAVYQRTGLFFTDSILCGASALALGTNAPTLLRKEALDYSDPEGAAVLGSKLRVKPEKAIVANCAAVREWDSNGTNFGYNPELGHVAGEFGHNDFYPVAIAACQQRGLGGQEAVKGMVLLDEIRGRLAEVFSLKTYKIDHVVHGAIASAATYGAMMGATPEQIESAIGMFVAHYTPWRAIRAGKQLSDSKGASAALSTEAAILCMKRSMAGFIGPKDIFRNPEALFRQFIPTGGDSPFDLMLHHSGDDFVVMGMHFKLGLYEHQSAGALHGLLSLLSQHPELAAEGHVQSLTIRAYEPAFGIIGDPAKRDPRTRQSADHSMVYIVATLLRKAIEKGNEIKGQSIDDLWQSLILTPYDYDQAAIHHPLTRRLMEVVTFEHGGPEYDAKYPDGIPTSVVIQTTEGKIFDSGLVMYPSGHARNQTWDRRAILQNKFRMLSELAFGDLVSVQDNVRAMLQLPSVSSADLLDIFDFTISDRSDYEDSERVPESRPA